MQHFVYTFDEDIESNFVIDTRCDTSRSISIGMDNGKKVSNLNIPYERRHELKAVFLKAIELIDSMHSPGEECNCRCTCGYLRCKTCTKQEQEIIAFNKAAKE